MKTELRKVKEKILNIIFKYLFRPDLSREEMIEFDPMSNLRPSFGNSTRGVDNPETQKKIIEIANKLIN